MAAQPESHDSELARGHFLVDLKHERLSVRANAADLREVLKAIGEINGLAIQVDPEVQGTVTTSFSDLPLQEGLRRLASSYALVFSEEAGTGKKSLLRVSVLEESTPKALSSGPGASASSSGPPAVRKSGSRAPGFPTTKRVIGGVLREEEKGVEYVPHEVLVKLKAGVPEDDIQSLLDRLGAVILKQYGAIGYFRLELPSDTTVAEAIAQLEGDALVDVVEPNYIVHATLLPSDPSFSSLWGLHNTGQTGGVADADIDAPEAWDVQRGSASVVVAVIDTGVDYNHPDLAANIWTNSGEIPGNGIDDDGNGYVDDYRGWDFYNNDNNPMDDNSHGTHVSGTIAAVGDNSVGVVGVNWTARIMPLKFLSSGGSGYTSDAVEAILYAADKGAKVLNNSWGGGGYSQALYDAIQTANNAGSLFIAAAGNNSSDNDLSPFYPASYDVANVVSVAASTSSDGLASFSNWGANTVDLAAPGASIYSTVPGGGYGTKSGTSMATPHVAGAAALLMAQFTGSGHLEVRSLLVDSVDPVAAFANNTLSGGRLNISTPIACQSGTLAVFSIAPSSGTAVALNEPLTLSARVTECGSAMPGATVSVSFSSGETTLTLFDDGAHDDGAASDGLYGASWTPSVEGDVSITVDASASGYTPGSGSSTVTVRDVIVYQHDETYPYQWIDATGGTNLGIVGDDASNLADIGFSFEFYGVTYTQVRVASNGYLTFGIDGTSYTNDPIPTTSSPNAVIAPFWDDLNPSVGGTVYLLSSGTAPNRSVTIQWTNVPHYPSTGAVTFQVTLYEGSNDIVMQYQDVTFEDATIDNGASATVGVEDVDGLFGTQYSYNTAALSSGQAIRFYTNTDTLSVSPAGTVDFGTVTVGDTTDQSFTVTNTGGGTLTGSASTSAPFSLVSGASYTLTAGQSATVVARFSPTAAQTYNGSVDFTSDGGDATRAVTGVGEAPPALGVSPSTTVDFGTVTVGTSADQSFTVTNTGGGTLTGSASTSAPYSIVSGGSYTLTAGQSATVVARFSPTATGVSNGSVSFTSDGGNATRSMTGVGEAAPALDVSPSTTVDFGTVTIGSSADQSFTVTNTGGSTLTGSASTSAPYSIVSGASYSLTAGQSATVVVRFSPTSTGVANGSVSFTSDGGNATRSVTGLGQAAPALDVSPSTTVDFGTVTIGSSADQSFTVTNTGGGTLTGSASTSAPFSIVSGSFYSLTAGQSATVVARFTPTVEGVANGSASFSSDGGNATRSVTGVGEAPPALGVSPTSTVDFGTVTVGSSVDQSFTVTNTGGGTLTGSASTSAPYSIISGGNYSLASGASATVVVRFSPTATGVSNGSVSFTSDGGNATRSVTGVGEAPPSIGVSPSTTVDFGTVTIGSSADQSFTVTNTGGGTLTGSASTSAPFSIVSGGSYTLTAGQSATVVARFSPTATGVANGSVSFTSDGGDATRSVTGVGEAPPALGVSPSTTVDFGTVTIGDSADQSFTVTNTGGGTLTGSASTSAPYSIVSGGSFSLTAGQSATVVVRFSPTAAGVTSGTVSFTSDGGNATRSVTGVGEAPPSIDVSPSTTVDFGIVTIGTSADQSFTVTNTGGGTLAGTASTSAPYSIVSGGSFSLTAGQSATVVVRFSPTSTGVSNGSVSFTSDGGNAARSVTGVGEAASALSVTPSGIVDFGTVTIGSSTDQSFTVTNTGGGTLTGSASTSAPYSIVSGGSYTLAAGQSATVVARFTPTAAQTYNGSVSFTSDGGNATRSVTGVGEEPAALSVSPTTTVDFGTVTVGDTADQSFTVTNTGGGTLTGSASTSAPYSIVSGASYTLTAGQSATVVARFSPTAAGVANGSVSFSSDGGNATLAVTGVGAAAPVLDVTPTAVDFGTVTIGSSADQSFTVTNTGGGTLTGTASTSAPYSIVSGASYTLTAGQSATVVARFSPTAAQTYNGSVDFTSDGGNETRSVTGVGEAAPTLEVSPSTTVDFGTVTVGSSADQSFTVTNTGGGTLTGSTSTSAPYSIVSGAAYTLTAGQSATVVVRFSPTAAGVAGGSVSFTSDGGDATRSVTGVGEAPSALGVSPSATVDFGTVTVGSSADQSFTVTNTGGGTLTGSASTSAPFSLESGAAYTLTAGQSATVVVRFSPTAAGVANGSVSFSSDGGNATRSVTGVGENLFDANSADITNPFFGLGHLPVDFGGYGTYSGSSRTVTNEGVESVLGVSSLKVTVSYFSGQTESYWFAQDVQGNVNVLKLVNIDGATFQIDSLADLPNYWLPESPTVGQTWTVAFGGLTYMTREVLSLTASKRNFSGLLELQDDYGGGDLDWTYYKQGQGLMVDEWDPDSGWELAASPSDILIGLGPGGMGFLETLAGAPSYQHLGWPRLGWSVYNNLNGETIPAAGDVDGDGRDELIIGVTDNGQGFLQLRDDHDSGYTHLTWIHLGWPNYNSDVGHTYPAACDVDGDGKDEIVVGVGNGGLGHMAVYDDADEGYKFLKWLRVRWGSYNTSYGGTRPACGDLDGDGQDEIVVGLFPGGQGFMEILDDASNNYKHLAWRPIGWPSYNAADGSTYPAVGDIDGDGKDEIAVGLGMAGSGYAQGYIEIFDDASTGYAHMTWTRVGWTTYNNNNGTTYPAIADIDGDGRGELLIGLAGPEALGYFQIRDDALTDFAHLGWERVRWGSYNSSDGTTYPIGAKLRQ